MTAMSMKQFTGMIPRSPDHLLEDGAAAYANNCDFSRRVLAPLKGGAVAVTYNGAIRSMYTAEGIHWYTWATDVVAHKSPVIDEQYDRIYYIEAGILKVATAPDKTRQVGGVPPIGQTFLVGVPSPVDAPTLTLIDRTSLADYPAATIEFKAWYSDGSASYAVETIPATMVTPWVRYAIVPPAKPPPPAKPEEPDGGGGGGGGGEGGGGSESRDGATTYDTTTTAPEGVVLVVQATAMEGNKRLFQMNTASGSTAPTTSSALPGGIVMTLEVVDGNYFVNFSWGVVETRAYTFTEVNTWDEESGPSPVSLISPTYLQDVNVKVKHPNWEPIGPGLGQYRPYKQTNVYRTYGGSQYIRAGHFSGYDYLDSARTVPSDAGTSLQSLTWVAPVIGMYGLVLAPNGWFAAFKDNILYMSEPYRPHTWQYTMTFAKKIVGVCVGAQSIVVTTGEATYIVTGPHPASVTSMTVPIPVGGVSHIGMCNVEGGVAFLSHDGIVVVEGSQASLDISHRYFTREVWRSMFGSVLTTLTLAYHDGCVIATSFYEPVVLPPPPVILPPPGFVLELDEASGAMTRFDYKFDSMMRLPAQDTLYYSVGTHIYRFREGAPLPATWNSKQFITPRYTKLGIGFARLSGNGTVTVALYADDELVGVPQTLTVVNALTKYFRLPSHRGSLKWQVRVTLTGACVVEDLAFAQSPAELMDV